MQFWLDTADVRLIKRFSTVGFTQGVTTNPIMISKQSHGPEVLIPELLKAFDGPLAVQVVGDMTDGMIHQAEKLYELNPRILVKIPVITEGYAAIAYLAKKNIPVLATAVFTTQQALIAASLGAEYIAPYIHHMEEQGINSMREIENMQLVLENQGLGAMIMGSSIKHITIIQTLAEMGVTHVTLRPEMFEDYFSSFSQTADANNSFTKHWLEYLEISA
jgi:fructose-6-phosphate aldolase 2